MTRYRERSSTFIPPGINLFLKEKISRDIQGTLKRCGENPGIRRQFEYDPEEEKIQDGFTEDPVGDASASIPGLPCLIRKYPDRLLVYLHDDCPVSCRFCFRRHINIIPARQCAFTDIRAYLDANPEIREVIFSGGDPFYLPLADWSSLAEEYYRLEKLQTIRFHTRTLTTFTRAYTEDLYSLFRKWNAYGKETVMVFHINHPCEIREPMAEILHRLRESGILLKHQMVLLRGVNDDVKILQKLFRKTEEMGISPYYIHHLDAVKGAHHFHVPTDEGISLIQDFFRSYSFLLAKPRYVQDSPSGKHNLLW